MRRITHTGEAVLLQLSRRGSDWVTVATIPLREVDWFSCVEWVRK